MRIVPILASLLVLAAPLAAQGHQHPGAGPVPAEGGQSAFAAIAEVVKMLLADPATDWTRVDVEGLRQHLIDMDEVTLNASITTRNVTNGISAEVTGSGRTTAAIRRMLKAHASFTNPSGEFRANVAEIPGGARIEIVPDRPAPSATARIRGLGVIGWLSLDDHHAQHHLMIAKGMAAH